MVLSRRSTLHLLLATTATVTAFVSKSPHFETRSRVEERISYSPPRSIVFLADKSYPDDVATKNESSEDNEAEKSSSTPKSPSYDYLVDSSLKEPESYLEDMASNSEGRSSISSSSSSDDTESSKSRSSEYLNDMATEDSVTRLDEDDDTTGNNNDSTSEEESNDDDTHTLAALLRIAASTGRGEYASPDQKNQASELIAALETKNPTPQPAKDPKIYGRWELVYSSTELFRSSPFFMAGRAVCTTKDQAEQYDWFCDMHRKALAISNIGSVRQVISPTLMDVNEIDLGRTSRMVSEFEVKVGAVPFLNSYSGGLPFTVDGSIVSSADITPTDDGRSWELLMDTVQIKGSNVPGLRAILDNGLQLQSRGLGSFLEKNLDGYDNPRPIFETTYLSDSIRISRDQDGKTFVYAKESDDSNITDYEKVDADFGVLKLLGQFNDKITKFYI